MLHKPSIPGQWVSRIVQTARECGQAVDEGWSLVPILIDPTAPPPEPSAPILETRRPRGRPRKAI